MKGFTLIELISVILILGILSIIVVPNFTGEDRNKELDKIANSVKSNLNFARSRALRTGIPIGVIFEEQSSPHIVILRLWQDRNRNQVCDPGEEIRRFPMNTLIQFDLGSTGNLPTIYPGSTIAITSGDFLETLEDVACDGSVCNDTSVKTLYFLPNGSSVDPNTSHFKTYYILMRNLDPYNVYRCLTVYPSGTIDENQWNSSSTIWNNS